MKRVINGLRRRKAGFICLVLAVGALLFSTAVLPDARSAAASDADGKPASRLPTGVRLDPAGRSFDVGNMPLAMIPSPDGKRIVLSLNGWREQGVQIIDRASGQIVQTLRQQAAFFGLAFSRDGQTLFASGGNEDRIFRYDFKEDQETIVDSIALAEKKPQADGTRFPAGIALSRNGKLLYVAENIADSLAVIDIASGRILQRLKTSHYPYCVVAGVNDTIYVSDWGADRIDVFRDAGNGRLISAGAIVAGRHPSALLLNSDGSRLFAASASTDQIAVVDTRTLKVIKQLSDASPAGTLEGSTPNALALSPDGTRLFVAEADNNAVAVFDLSTKTAGTKSGGSDTLAGRIPSGWYPTALTVSGSSLLVANGKGRGSSMNPKMDQPDKRLDRSSPDYTLGQLNGTITEVSLSFTAADLKGYTDRVGAANHWDRPASTPKYPPFKHVIYIIKENRTYDQVFGDMPGGDGDSSLLYFGRDSTPNHRAIAERFGLFDRFFVNAEVSQQGHQWSTSAYVTDYTERTTPSIYSNRRAGPDDEKDVDEPVSGYLWDAALKRGLSLRNYGEFALPAPDSPASAKRYRPLKAALVPHTSTEYPAFDMDIRDQKRVDAWLAEFGEFTRKGALPALEIMHLPGDHTSGGRAGKRTPRAYMADNDQALGRIVEALSNSPSWKDTVVFVLEDDAQDGPDHVDSHRSVLMVISAYNRAGAVHRFVNTTDVVKTIEEILGLKPLSQFDFYGRPLGDVFSAEPDLRAYAALKPVQSMDELNPSTGHAARMSERLDFSKPDVADTDTFNRVLWSAIKGDNVPYPGINRMPSLIYFQGR
jgi:DNA-binding beta-propeller fold protein YncE